MESQYDSNGYLTRASLLREIRDIVARDHADIDRGDLLVNLASPWHVVKYPTGLIAKCATVILRHPDFKERRCSVFQEPGKKWYMS